MSVPTSHAALQRALQVIAYEWAMRPEDYRDADEIDLVEALRAHAEAFPGPCSLAGSYGSVVRLAALALTTLAALPPPDEVDGLTGFEGFEVWQASRRA